MRDEGKGWDINFRVQWIHLVTEYSQHNLFITWLTAKTHTALQLHTIQTFFGGCYDNNGTLIITEYTLGSCVHLWSHGQDTQSSEPTICKLL